MEVGSQLSGHIGFWRNSLHPVAVPSNLVARLSAETPKLETNDVPHPLSGGLRAQRGATWRKDILTRSCRDTTRFFRQPRPGLAHLLHSKVGIGSAGASFGCASMSFTNWGRSPARPQPEILEVATLSTSDNDKGERSAGQLDQSRVFCQT
jgi:hypothetical protein